MIGKLSLSQSKVIKRRAVHTVKIEITVEFPD